MLQPKTSNALTCLLHLFNVLPSLKSIGQQEVTQAFKQLTCVNTTRSICDLTCGLPHKDDPSSCTYSHTFIGKILPTHGVPEACFTFDSGRNLLALSAGQGLIALAIAIFKPRWSACVCICGFQRKGYTTALRASGST